MALFTSKLQNYVDDILQFFSNWKMSINPDKIEAIIFIRRSMILPPSVTVENYRVPWSKRIKYLGMVLDLGLCWGPIMSDSAYT